MKCLARRIPAAILALLASLATAAAQGVEYCFGGVLCPCGNVDAAAGCANSTGAGAYLTASGSSSVSADDLVLSVSSCPAHELAVLFMGPAEAAVPFGDATLCVGAGTTGLRRLITTTTGASGQLALGPGIVFLSQVALPPAGAIVPGSTWHFQAWYQDATGPCGSGVGLSNGYRVTFGT